MKIIKFSIFILLTILLFSSCGMFNTLFGIEEETLSYAPLPSVQEMEENVERCC